MLFGEIFSEIEINFAEENVLVNSYREIDVQNMPMDWSLSCLTQMPSVWPNSATLSKSQKKLKVYLDFGKILNLRAFYHVYEIF